MFVLKEKARGLIHSSMTRSISASEKNPHPDVLLGQRDEAASEARNCAELLERAKKLGFSANELERMQELYGCDWDSRQDKT